MPRRSLDKDVVTLWSLICDIEGYLKVHTQAKDSISGVRIWLTQQRMEARTELIQEALDYLVSRGLIVEGELPDGTKVYGKPDNFNK